MSTNFNYSIKPGKDNADILIPDSSSNNPVVYADGIGWGTSVTLGDKTITADSTGLCIKKDRFNPNNNVYSVTTSQILNTLVSMINGITPGENPGDPSVPHTV